jgi:small subunit ribosomal protein S6
VVRSQRSLRTTQREYETVLILKPDANKSQIKRIVTNVQQMFADAGASLISADNWGLRTLAYPIKRNTRGIYLYLRFLGGSDTVLNFEQKLRLTETVLRYLTVKVDEDIDPTARPSEVSEDLLEAVSDTGPDPVEIERQRQTEEAAKAASEAAAAAEVAAAEAAAAAPAPEEAPAKKEEAPAKEAAPAAAATTEEN